MILRDGMNGTEAGQGAGGTRPQAPCASVDPSDGPRRIPSNDTGVPVGRFFLPGRRHPNGSAATAPEAAIPEEMSRSVTHPRAPRFSRAGSRLGAGLHVDAAYHWNSPWRIAPFAKSRS